MVKRTLFLSVIHIHIHTNSMNSKVTFWLSVCDAFTAKRLHRFQGKLAWKSLILKEGQRLRFTAITDVHAGGAASKW